jgi:hypothetical protein
MSLSRNLNMNQPYDPRGHAGGGGYYHMSFSLTAIAANLAASSPIFSIFWNPVLAIAAGRVMRFQLKMLKLNAIVTTGFTAAQEFGFKLFKAKSFTAADTGGTQVIPATGDQKKQNAYVDSQFVSGGDIRHGAPLTAGTRTLEAQPFRSIQGYAQTTAGVLIPMTYQETFDEHHVPLCLEPKQGIVIITDSLMPAAGQVNVFLDIDWMEEYEPGGW